MRDPELINSIGNLTNSINDLVLVSGKWWNTQLFSGLVGAVAAFWGSWLLSVWKERQNRLAKYYQWFLEEGEFDSPSGLLLTALHTVHDNKTLGEKMVIEFKSHNKYWYQPLSKIRVLLGCYEKALGEIKDAERNEIKNTSEYQEAEKRFKAVEDFVYKKTGETYWTS